MEREDGNGDGRREPVEDLVREKNLKFRCPRCGGNSLKLVGKAHIRLLITDDLPYASTLEDSIPESERTFRCWDCDFLIADENGPVRRTWSLARWLRENCSQVAVQNGDEPSTSKLLRFVCPLCGCRDLRVMEQARYYPIAILDGIAVNAETFKFEELRKREDPPYWYVDDPKEEWECWCVECELAPDLEQYDEEKTKEDKLVRWLLDNCPQTDEGFPVIVNCKPED